MKKKWIVSVLVLLCVCALGLWYGTRSGGSEFPTLEKVAAMTEEAATKALAGTFREELQKAWGEPDSGLSGLYGDVYEAPGGRAVIIYYDVSLGKGACVNLVKPVEDW